MYFEMLLEWNSLEKDMQRKNKNRSSCILTRPTPLSWFEVSKPSLKAHLLLYLIIFITSKRHSILWFYLQNFFRWASTLTQRHSLPSFPLSFPLHHLTFHSPGSSSPHAHLPYTPPAYNTPPRLLPAEATSIDFYFNLIDRMFLR